MKLLKLCVLLSIAVLICIEVYQITKLTRVVESALVNKKGERGETVEDKGQSYLWCMSECTRQMSQQFSPIDDNSRCIDDYSRCIDACNKTRVNHNKKVDILTTFT